MTLGFGRFNVSLPSSLLVLERKRFGRKLSFYVVRRTYPRGIFRMAKMKDPLTPACGRLAARAGCESASEPFMPGITTSK